MTAPSKVARATRVGVSPAKGRKPRKFPVSDGAPVEVVEDGPSLQGRLLALAAMLTIKPTLAIGSYAPRVPWPFGLVDMACRVLKPAPGTVRATIALPNCNAAADSLVGSRTSAPPGNAMRTGNWPKIESRLAYKASMPRTVWLPKGVSDEQVSFYRTMLEKVRATQEWKEWLQRGSQTDAFLSGSELDDYIASDERWLRGQFAEDGWLVK